MKTFRIEFFSIPLACWSMQDTLVWKFEASGNYTVKSGYRVLSTEQLQTSSYSEEKYRAFYKVLWELQIPAKIKILVWRLFNNYVPHFVNLFQRRLSTDVVCPLCKEGLEDTDHLIWKSVLARNKERQCLGACTYPSGDVADAVVAEAKACERAILFMVEMGWRRIILEGDPLTIIKKLALEEEDRSLIRPIINNICALGKRFESVSYQFVPRTVNCATHTLALQGH
ncbi:hypothetical protein J1N35_034404 [Gossypium stocksii]|uniref:RNase H type-1 domain-containing protein n=1 Tax=Gossypium stocksii TaxID=47602 RepID=A0A9D3UST3_9ROSI|nr:hypothetical protein J1N35_034404 [Gossypium stocksii]